MKKLMLLSLLAVVLSTPVWAHNVTQTTINNVSDPTKQYGDFGAKLDAPNLIKLPWGFSAGLEGGKSLYDNNMQQGYFGYGKLTYTGSLLDFSGKK